MSKNSGMRAYTRFSYFVEDTLELGRNGKRAAVGGIAAGGTFAAGHYGGVEVINNNMPQAIIGAAVAGFGLTMLADFALIDDHEEALMSLARLENANATNPIMKKIAEDDAELRKMLGLDGLAGLAGGAPAAPEAPNGPSVFNRRTG